MANNKLDVTELDFNTIKDNLKIFLETNPVFTDYNFGGSALDVLNSQLAYNTHYLGFYAHMLFNEAFLDTAVKRESVVSHAKQLNYTPKSISASVATIDINVVPTGTPVDISIPRDTIFRSTIDGSSHVFVTLEDAIATPTGVGNTYKASEVSLVQGLRTQLAYVKNASDTGQRFILPFSNIDTKYLEVTVQKEESDAESDLFAFTDSIIDINGDSEVYFLQEAERGNFELYFGDGVLGKALEHGNVIIVTYLRTDGEDANGASVFTPVDSIGGSTSITVDTIQPATGGAEPDTLEFIKRIAPRAYESQKRSVTARDYETFLLQDTSVIPNNFSAVQAWGGEDNVPALYGNVLISFKAKDGVVVTSFLKNQIKELLDASNVVGVIPIIVDPEFLYLELDVAVTYANNKTVKTRDQIVTEVTDLLKTYRDNSLSFFEKAFRHSEVACMVDDSDPAFISNLIDIRMKRFETLLFNQVQNYTIDFRNPIEEGSLQSAEFFVTEFTQENTDRYYFEDDRAGNVVLKKIAIDNTVSTVNATFGTINYQTGDVNLNCFVPINLIGGDEFWISVKPAIDDIFTVRNLIISFRDEDLTVSATGITV